MPTTLPLDPGDDAEGQLKPIAEFAVAAPPMAAVHATPVAAPVKPTPVAQPAPVRPRPTVSSASPGHTLRTTLNAPSLSLNRKHADAAAVQTQTQAAAAQTARMFTDDELAKAWSNFIDTHGTDRLLVNTMRVSMPQRTAVANTFEMVVESEIQVELINEAMPMLLAELRRALQNDLLSIHVRANNGASSPMTWNEREVLADMIERHPTLKAFVDDLGLSLL